MLKKSSGFDDSMNGYATRASCSCLTDPSCYYAGMCSGQSSEVFDQYYRMATADTVGPMQNVYTIWH